MLLLRPHLPLYFIQLKSLSPIKSCNFFMIQKIIKWTKNNERERCCCKVSAEQISLISSIKLLAQKIGIMNHKLLGVSMWCALISFSPVLLAKSLHASRMLPAFQRNWRRMLFETFSDYFEPKSTDFNNNAENEILTRLALKTRIFFEFLQVADFDWIGRSFLIPVDKDLMLICNQKHL